MPLAAGWGGGVGGSLQRPHEPHPGTRFRYNKKTQPSLTKPALSTWILSITSADQYLGLRNVAAVRTY